MKKAIARFLMSLSGWTVNPHIPAEAQRCVMIAAPHTSNWDIWYARLAFFVLGIPVKFTIKREWMRFPFNLIIGPLGGVGIDRKPRKAGQERSSYVESMAKYFLQHPRFVLLITPEGTRSRRTEWKTGFYYLAKAAGVPICLGYLNYAKKEAGVGPAVYPTDDMAADMRKIMAFYREIPGKHPENFSIDERYG